MNPASTYQSGEAAAATADRGFAVPCAQRQQLQTLGLLAGGLAHDLNTLLTTVVSHAETAESLLAPPHPARGELTLVRDAAHRAAGLSRRMLQFASPVSRERTAINLVALVEEALPLLRAGLPGLVDLRPHFDLHAGFVTGDPNQLLQVFLQLGLNAAQPISDGAGCIEVRISRTGANRAPIVDVGVLGPGPHLCLSVSNTGVPLDAIARLRLRETFLAPGEPEEDSGLAFVRELVLESGGGIAIESAPGASSRIQIYLPEVPMRGAVAAPKSETAHIVVIDDEETVLHLAEQALQFAGYRVTALSAAKDCVANLTREPALYDLIITDQRMPDLSGMELLRALRALGQNIPVVVTSGSLAGMSARELHEVTPARFLPKPFTLTTLLTVVRQMLATRSEAHC